MDKKQVIRINENQLRQIVTESVKRVLKEESNTPQSLLFSIRAWIKGIHQEIDKFDIANENGRGDIILPQFINNLRNILQQIDDECKELKGLISMQHT